MELRSTLEENLMFTPTLAQDRISTPRLLATHRLIRLLPNMNVRSFEF